MRPAMVLSVDKFNHGPADLLIVVPITKTNRAIPTHVMVPAGEAGLTFESYIKCEDLRSISKDRLVRHMGDVTYPRVEVSSGMFACCWGCRRQMMTAACTSLRMKVL